MSMLKATMLVIGPEKLFHFYRLKDLIPADKITDLELSSAEILFRGKDVYCTLSSERGDARIVLTKGEIAQIVNILHILHDSLPDEPRG